MSTTKFPEVAYVNKKIFFCCMREMKRDNLKTEVAHIYVNQHFLYEFNRKKIEHTYHIYI